MGRWHVQSSRARRIATLVRPFRSTPRTPAWRWCARTRATASISAYPCRGASACAPMLITDAHTPPLQAVSHGAQRTPLCQYVAVVISIVDADVVACVCTFLFVSLSLSVCVGWPRTSLLTAPAARAGRKQGGWGDAAWARLYHRAHDQRRSRACLRCAHCVPPVPTADPVCVMPAASPGTHADDRWPDDWTAVTVDGKLSAQFEHTLLVTETGVEILTAAQGLDSSFLAPSFNAKMQAGAPAPAPAALAAPAPA
jgi:hypothetical protein